MRIVQWYNISPIPCALSPSLKRLFFEFVQITAST